MKLKLSRLLAATAVLALAAFGAAAQARSDVHWSVGIHAVPGVHVGVGNGYYPAPVYVAPPPPVYYQPAPVYYAPQPVYVRPAPVYYGRPYGHYHGHRHHGGPRHHGGHHRH